MKIKGSISKIGKYNPSITVKIYALFFEAKILMVLKLIKREEKSNNPFKKRKYRRGIFRKMNGERNKGYPGPFQRL